MQSVFESRKKVKTYLLEKYAHSKVVQCTGVCAIKGDDVLEFYDVNSATSMAPDSTVFSYIYDNGKITKLTPEN